MFNFINFLKFSFVKYINSILIINDEIYINTSNINPNEFLFFLKNNSLLNFKSLMDIWCNDFPNKLNRFEVNYLLLSIKFNIRIIIKFFLNYKENIYSINNLYNSSIWLEREIWDLFGIYFNNHIDLRRILTDYGFEGFALRKDFPLSGFLEIRYDDSLNNIIFEPLNLVQELRYFDFQTPWNLIKDIDKL
jgi:NADH-quinone oxidoreductase subunit C